MQAGSTNSLYRAAGLRSRERDRRVGDGDIEALALMLGLAEEIDTAITGAVKGLRTCGYSWAEIGSRLGITLLAATVFAHESAALGVHVLAAVGGDLRRGG